MQFIDKIIFIILLFSLTLSCSNSGEVLTIKEASWDEISVECDTILKLNSNYFCCGEINYNTPVGCAYMLNPDTIRLDFLGGFKKNEIEISGHFKKTISTDYSLGVSDLIEIPRNFDELEIKIDNIKYLVKNHDKYSYIIIDKTSFNKIKCTYSNFVPRYK